MPAAAKARWLALLIIALGALTLGAAYTYKPPAQKKPQVSAKPVVQTLPLTLADYPLTIRSQGTVQPRNSTTLVTEVAGEVIDIASVFEAGGLFKRGDVLLRIDPHDYQVAVQQAEAALAGAKARLAEELGKAEVARREWASLIKQGRKPTDLALRKPYVDQAKAAVDSAQADLAAAERKLARTQIRAPYDGMVQNRQADLGQYVNLGTALGQVFATDSAEVRLPIADQQLPFLYSSAQHSVAHQQAVNLSAQFGEQSVSWPARIVRSEATVDERNRMHYLVARIDDPYNLRASSTAPALKVGSFVQAAISGEPLTQVYRLPRSLLRGDNQLLVADRDDRLQQRTLTLLRSTGQYIYFRSGTEPGDRAIQTALELPVPGTALQVNPATQQATP